MGLLEKNRVADRDEIETEHQPRFDKNGKVQHKWVVIPKIIGFIIILLGLLIGAVHVPVLLYKEPEVTEKNTFYIKPNEAGIRNAIQYIQDHPNDDIDGDGLTNAEEVSQGTDPRNLDTDNDGVSDFAEIYAYNTRPTEADNQIEEVFSKVLADNNINYNTPYRIHDVILWADNIQSRAHGIFVPSLRGYRFTGFDGWIQIPGNVYAYRLEDGMLIPLEYREKENVWRVESYGKTEEVIVYGSELKKTHMLTALNKNFAVEDDGLAGFLATILPKEHSFITIKDVVLQDMLSTQVNATVTGTTMPKFDRNDFDRFGKCTNGMTELADVYTSIISGKPVIVSLQSARYGEVICLAYGYTEYGDLLICDEEGNKVDDNGTPMMLDIVEMAALTVNQNGEIMQREYFDFKGMGYDSKQGDSIHFIFAE